MTIYVSVRRAIVAANARVGTRDCPFEIRQTKDDQNPTRVSQAQFVGTIRLVYNPESLLVSGAACWLEIDEKKIDCPRSPDILYVLALRETIILNQKTGKRVCPYEIRRSKNDPEPMRVSGAEFSGTVRLIYDPDKPFGSSCWLEIETAMQ